MEKKIPKYLIDEINYKVIKNLKHTQNVYGRVDIDINMKHCNIFKEYGINGRFKENKFFNQLIRNKLRRFEEGDFYTCKDLQVKVRSFKPISFVNENHNVETIRKPYSLLSFSFVRVSNVE